MKNSLMYMTEHAFGILFQIEIGILFQRKLGKAKLFLPKLLK
jgi:hypothetical protein